MSNKNQKMSESSLDSTALLSWISFKDTKPKDNEAILVTNGRDIVAADYMIFGETPRIFPHGIDGYDVEWEDMNLSEATHWCSISTLLNA